VTVGWLTSTLHRHSFGIIMLSLGLLATTPVGSSVPGLILAVGGAIDFGSRRTCFPAFYHDATFADLLRQMAAAAPPSSVMNSRLLIIRSPGRHGRALAANFELQRLRCLKVDGWELRRLAGPMVSELISDQCARASRQIVLELLAEVPIAASLGGIRPIPAQ